MLRVTNKSFRYTPSFDTNLKKKFARIARQQRAGSRRTVVEAGQQEHSVVPIVGRRIIAKI